jgi:hypothetical protein
MRRPTVALLVGLAGVVASVFACQTSPAAPAAPRALNLTGTWSGNLSDAQGAAMVTWTLTQAGQAITGTAVTKPADPNDGTCASCHKNKAGTFNGMLSGTTLTLTMAFQGGDPGEPTPICSVTLAGTSSNITDDSVIGTYSGTDSCEGPFADGKIALTRQR